MSSFDPLQVSRSRPRLISTQMVSAMAATERAPASWWRWDGGGRQKRSLQKPTSTVFREVTLLSFFDPLQVSRSRPRSMPVQLVSAMAATERASVSWWRWDGWGGMSVLIRNPTGTVFREVTFLSSFDPLQVSRSRSRSISVRLVSAGAAPERAPASWWRWDGGGRE